MTDEKKIYTYVEMDMTQPEIPVVDEEFYYCSGNLALCQDKDDEFETDTSEGGGDKEETDTSGSGGAESVEELRGMLKETVQSTQSNAQAIREMQNLLKETQEQQAPKGKEKEEEPPPQNLEVMDREKFAEYILKQAKKLFQDEIGNVNQEVQSAKKETNQERMERIANEMRGNYKDFDEWQQEMYQLYQEMNVTDLRRLYKLARAENPDKAAKIDKKQAQEEKKAKEEEKGKESEEPEHPFGGYTPSSKKVDEAKKETLSPKQAGEKAWELVMGKDEDVT